MAGEDFRGEQLVVAQGDDASAGDDPVDLSVSPGSAGQFALRSCTWGKVEAVKAVTDALATQWVTAWLWCPRDVAVRRIAQRDTGDATARLRAWDETPCQRLASQ